MHILYDHMTFGQQRYGGISRYFTEIIPRIASRQDCEVSLFMGLHINRYGLEKNRKDFAKFWGVRRPFIAKTHQLSQYLNERLFRRFARRLPFDIYHTTGPQFVTGVPSDRRRVITVHDMIYHNGFWKRSPVFERNIEKFMRDADGVICVSESTKRDVIRFVGINEERIAVIHHGAPKTVVASPERVVADPYVLYVGMRLPYKNADLLVEAFARSPAKKTHRLVLFGGGALKESERTLVQRLGIEERLIVIPRGDDAALANLYTHAAAMVYPSNYEGFGMPLLEGFAYRCPVISSNASSLPEVGGDAAVYFDPQNVDDLVEKLQKVLDTPSLRESLISAGQQRLAVFDWNRCAAETVNFYGRVLEGVRTKQ